ncbi:DNAse I-like superfamily protein [Euphorbia peplus]|nr:DNAse I-like superfamily protein [Euphorbia peplus]
MSFLFWNCQGAASGQFLRSLKLILSIHKPSLIALLETKISGSSAEAICRKVGFSSWVRVEALGFSGGIWLFWNCGMKVDILFTNPQFILCRIQESNRNPWLLAAVYGSPDVYLRKNLWNTLSHHNFDLSEPWLVAGDFNAVLNARETTSSTNNYTHRNGDFVNWVAEEGLIDLGCNGPSFTWMRGNSEDSYSAARLDRALCNLDWRSSFPNASVTHLPRLNSDHSPILVRLNEHNLVRTNKKFRSELAWFSHPDFLNQIQSIWNRNVDFMTNTMALTNHLSDWNSSVFGNIFRKKRRLLARIKGIQNSLANRFNSSLKKMEKQLQHDLDDVLKEEELFWYQKSRKEWIVSGDRNTKYFHVSTIIRRNRNHIRGLYNDEGVFVDNDIQLAKLAMDFFSNLYTSDGATVVCRNQHLHHMEDSNCLFLSHNFTKCEIRKALFDMAPSKAAGPDGFNAGFYQKAWPILGDAIYELFINF